MVDVTCFYSVLPRLLNSGLVGLPLESYSSLYHSRIKNLNQKKLLIIDHIPGCALEKNISYFPHGFCCMPGAGRKLREERVKVHVTAERPENVVLGRQPC